jgi:hypothetical protein
MAVNRTKFFRTTCAHCNGPIEYPAELVGTSTPCPHCGENTELDLPAPPVESGVPRRLIVWTAIAAVILVAGLVAAMVALNRAKNLANQNRKPAAATVQTNTPAVTNTAPRR